MQDDASPLPLTVRKVFIIGPDTKVKAILVYPTSAGRYFPEILRLIDALQLSAKAPVATPVNWQPGQDVSTLQQRWRQCVKLLLHCIAPACCSRVHLPCTHALIRMSTRCPLFTVQ